MNGAEAQLSARGLRGKVNPVPDTTSAMLKGHTHAHLVLMERTGVNDRTSKSGRQLGHYIRSICRRRFHFMDIRTLSRK